MFALKVVVGAFGTVLAASLFKSVHIEASVILDLFAVATIAGSMLVYSRIKAALVVSESAAQSWQSECAAQKERADRNQESLKQATLAQTELIAKLAALEQRPDLTRLESLVAEGTESMKKHEVAAGERTDRLIATLEERLPPKQEAA